MANETTLFQDLQVKAFRAGVAPRTKSAQKWFQLQVQNMKNINRWDLMKNKELTDVKKPKVGEMFMYFYEPKHADVLPYYDTFPLIIMVDKAPGGFYGLNLHYLPNRERAKFFDALMGTMNNKLYDETTRMKVNYQLLQSVKKLKYFKACFKHYLTSHVESQIVRVDPTEWEIALFLPVQRFKKASIAQIYSDSRRKY